MEHPRLAEINRRRKENFLGGAALVTRAQMLAIVLYTGCDCNYAMCAAERSGDRKTWRWFSWLLRQAIRRLSSDTEASIAYSGNCIFRRVHLQLVP